jgi:patatin-like phospholipase/acyl hydrolase
MDNIIRSNVEREEKEKLFKSKVQELKSIFEKENLENLKGLKFDVEELTKLLQDEPEETESGITEEPNPA